MAINFGKLVQGVATGYMGQSLAKDQANDEMKGRIIERAGLNFYENTLPKFQKTEKNRKAAYDKLSNIYSPEVAEFFGEQGLITGDGNDIDVISKQIKDRGIDKDYINSYVKQQGSSYNQRYKVRVKDIQEQEKFVMGNIEKNQMGSMTAKLLLGQDKDQETTTDATAESTMSTKTQVPEIQTQVPETETITTEGTMVPGTPIKTIDTTEEFPIDATKITGDFDKAFPLERNKLELSVPEIQSLTSAAETSFAKNVIKDLGGVKTIPKESKYLIGYDKNVDKDRTKYAMDRYKKEYIGNIVDTYKQQVSETQVSSKFAIPEGTKVSDIVIQARERIAQISNGTGSDDQKDSSIEELKTIVSGQLNSMGIEPGKFGF